MMAFVLINVFEEFINSSTIVSIIIDVPLTENSSLVFDI